MPAVTWRKVAYFLTEVILVVAVLAVLADFFFVAIQGFIAVSMPRMQPNLPTLTFVRTQSQAGSTQSLREAWEAAGWPENQQVVMDLGETTARIDFSFEIKKDHSLAGSVLRGDFRNQPEELVRALFGKLIIGPDSGSGNFHAPSIEVDTESGSVTTHILVVAPIGKWNLVVIAPDEGITPLELGDTIVVVNYAGRRLLRLFGTPSDSSEGQITLEGNLRSAAGVETEWGETAAPILSEFTSRQSFLQQVNNRLDFPFFTVLLGAILEALPLLIFLFILWRWKDDIPVSLKLVAESVLALLTFHFAFYLVNAIRDLVYSVTSRIPSAMGVQVPLYSPLYRALELEPPQYFEPLGFLSVGTALMGVLIPALLLRRSRQWDKFGKGDTSLTDPFSPGIRPAAGKPRPDWFSIVTYAVIGLLVVFPVVYFFYFRRSNDFLNTAWDDITRHLLLVCFLVGLLGSALIVLFKGLYHRLDGRPIPPATIPIAFWVILVGNLIWSYTIGWQMSAGRDVSLQAGWFWLAYSTLVGAALVYAILHLVYALARQAEQVPEMSPGTRKVLIFVSLLSAIPLRLLYSSSAPAATYQEVWTLAAQLDNLIKFIFLAGLTWFFHQQGKQGLALNRLTITVGLIAAATVLYPSGSRWFILPLTFILGYLFLHYYIRPAEYWNELEPLYAGVFQERIKFLEEIVHLNSAERAYREFQKALREKMAKENLGYAEYRKELDARRKELDESIAKARVQDKPIKDVALTFGPESTAWKNGVHGALWAGIFSVPWMMIWLYSFMTGEATTLAYPLWSFFTDLLNLLLRWLGIGFLFGFFYPFLRGKNGLEKGFRLWLVIVLPALPLALIDNSTATAWQGFFFWVLQVFLHCMLLGLIAFDYVTLRQGYRDWQMLFELHGIPSVGVSISTILIAAGTALTTLLQARTGEIVTAALSFFLPSPEKIAEAETILTELEQAIRNIP